MRVSSSVTKLIVALLPIGVGNDTAEFLFMRGIDDAGRAGVVLGLLVEGVQVTVGVHRELQQTDTVMTAPRVVERDPVIIGERVRKSSRSCHKGRLADGLPCMFHTDVEVAVSVLTGECICCLWARSFLRLCRGGTS